MAEAQSTQDQEGNAGSGSDGQTDMLQPDMHSMREAWRSDKKDPSRTLVELQHVEKHYGSLHVLKDINLKVTKGEVLVVLGPSGSGKSTMCRTINRLETVDSGSILIDGEPLPQEGKALADLRAEVGMVFQQFNLFANKTILDNVTLAPIKVRHMKKGEAQDEAMELLARVGVDSQAGKMPSQLSGGQQQRVALARALATAPEVVLFDEPFGALDVQVRQDLRLWLKGLQRELGFTGVFVTHDREEALDLADRIVVMRHGAIAQNADPQQLYAAPADAQVFNFMSDTRRFPARLENHILHSGRGWAKAERPLADGDGELALRVQDLELTDHPPGHVQLAVVIEHSTLLGANYRLTVKNQGWGDDARWRLPLPAQTWLRQPLQHGQRAYLNPRRLYFLRTNGTVEALFREE